MAGSHSASANVLDLILYRAVSSYRWTLKGEPKKSAISSVALTCTKHCPSILRVITNVMVSNSESRSPAHYEGDENSNSKKSLSFGFRIFALCARWIFRGRFGTHSGFRNVVGKFTSYTVQKLQNQKSMFIPRWKFKISKEAVLSESYIEFMPRWMRSMRAAGGFWTLRQRW
jgi:hypothetical protein